MGNEKRVYRNRITDSALKLKLEAFGATLIVGPKGCGKTTTGKHFAKSFIEFQDEDNRDRYLSVADNMPSKLLIGAFLGKRPRKPAFLPPSSGRRRVPPP